MQLSNSKPVSEVVSEEHQQLQNVQSGGAGSEPKATMEQLDTQLAEMKHSQHGLLQEAYRIKRERNALVPLHRLPGEIFVSILLRVAKNVVPGSEQENKVLHSIAQVSTYWFDTILTFPSFWDLLALYHPPRFREWVLKRNTSGLFYIECVPSREETGPVGETLLSFTKMAAALSERWKQLTFDGEATDEIMELLQSPTPNLDSLIISSWESLGAGSRMLELGEGRNIQYLDIDNIIVPWSSTRLRGLRGVQIQHVSGILPSLAELHAMLAASPELWWLQLLNWFPSDDGTALASEVTSSQIRPITLPFLTTLILHQIPAEVTQFVLSSITAPTCQCVIAQEVPLSLLNNPASGGTFTALINGALKAIPKFLLEYKTGSGRLDMLTQPQTTAPYDWIDHVDEIPGLNVHIPTEGLSNSQLGSFLSLLNFPDVVEIATDIHGATWAPSLLYVGWHRVPKLKVSDALAVEAICEQLANISAPTTCQNRLRSFSSQFDPYGVPSDILDSIVRNLVVYVQRTCARKEKDRQFHGSSGGEPDRRILEIKMPFSMFRKLREPLHDWDVQLSESGQGMGQNVDEGMSDSSSLPHNLESLELNE